MTQSSKKFKQIINQVFANVNHVMQMCHEDVVIASMDEQIYTYSFGDKHVTVTAYVNYKGFEYAPQFTIAAYPSITLPPSRCEYDNDILGHYFYLLIDQLYYMTAF